MPFVLLSELLLSFRGWVAVLLDSVAIAGMCILPRKASTPLVRLTTISYGIRGRLNIDARRDVIGRVHFDGMMSLALCSYRWRAARVVLCVVSYSRQCISGVRNGLPATKGCLTKYDRLFIKEFVTHTICTVQGDTKSKPLSSVIIKSY